ncbi:MAG: hypothetical protein KJ607_08170, partial [Bacteroidetes bacterium]|nr:hypothetical protein [Bacteroidota bacterium]
MNISGIVYTLIICLLSFSLFAQSLEREANTNFEDENYRVALKQYLKLIKTDEKNLEFNYRIGVCYLNLNMDKTEAIPYLNLVDSLNDGYYEDVKYQLALAYMHNHDFDKAVSLFKAYKESIRDKIDTEKIRELNRLAEMCDNAKELIKEPLNVTFYNLGTNINSQREDYNPRVTPDGTFMVFSSDKRYIRDYQQYVRNCYYSIPVKNDFGEWAKAMSLGKRVTTEENEDVVGMSLDGSKVLIHLDNLTADNDIGISEKRTTSFKEVVVFGKEINSKAKEEGACFSITGDTLFFASDKQGGIGGFDLYYSVKKGKEEWSEAVNLGEPVNSKYDENYPEISADGKTLR